MAITVSQVLDFPSASIKRLDIPGDVFLGVVELAGDSSYPTGGYPITPALLGLMNIKFAVPLATNDGHVAVLDQANMKVKLFVGDNPNASVGPLVEKASGSNVSTTRIYLLVAGV